MILALNNVQRLIYHKTKTNINITYSLFKLLKVLFDAQIGSYLLLLRVSVDQDIITMRVYSTFPSAPRLGPYHHIFLVSYPGHSVEGYRLLIPTERADRKKEKHSCLKKKG